MIVASFTGLDLLEVVGVLVLAVVLFRELCGGMPGGEERAETERDAGVVAENQSAPWTRAEAVPGSLPNEPGASVSRSVSVPFDGLGGLDQEQTA